MAIITVDSLNNMENPSLAIANGNPAISYYDSATQEIKYVRATNSSGTLWGTPIVVVGSFNNESTSMAIVNGNPAIVYSDGSTTDVLYIRATDANGTSWGTPVVASSSLGSVGFTSSVLVVNGNPAIAYSNSIFPDQYEYVRASDVNGVSWGAPVTIEPSFSNDGSISMTIVNGNPAVAYGDNITIDLHYVRATNVSGTSWGTPAVTGGSTTTVNQLSMAVVNGNPSMAYVGDGGNVLYVRATDVDGTSWGTPVVIETASSRPFLAVVNGNPAISYIDGSSDLAYVRSSDINGGSWGAATMIAASGDEPTSLVIANGNPAISYIANNGDLNFAAAEDANGDVWVDDNSSSSTSDSSGSSFSSSSSSSAPFTFTEQLNQIIAGNNPDNLMLFTYTPESGFSENVDDNKIFFQFRTVNNEFFNYDTLLNPTTPTEIASASNCYVPQDDDVDIKHDPIFYVDLIVKDSGVKDISVRSQEEKYKDEQVKYSFIIPKFTWNQDLITDAIASNVAYTPLDDATGSFWAGTSDDKLYKIEYSANVAAEAFSTNEEGTIKNLLVNSDGDQMYVTTDEKLKKYTVGHYIDNADQPQLFITEDVSIDNVYKVMSWYDANIWSALPELGTIQELDQDFLTKKNEISGFDAPFKIIRSDYHNATFVAGTNVLWKYDGTIKAIYAIEGYEISDFDISDNGLLCIALNGADDSYLRVIDRNFFRLLINERFTDGLARFCKFCSNDFFYGLSEIDIGGDQFVAQHHTYNTINGSYNVTQSPNVLFTPQVEETPTPATDPVEIEYPNGGENVLIGGELEVLWKSNKSVNDSVKIELYKEGTFLRTITNSTPNTGVFSWTVPATLGIASDYKIRMEWLANEVNDANEDFSDADFNMVDIFPSSSETEIEFFGSIGVDYDRQNNQMVIVLKSGLVGFLSFDDFSFQGWVDSGIIDYTAMVVKNEKIKEIGTVSKVRIFVGSKPYLSDRWDSGVIETDLNSIYYGGGDNLVPGESYYVNIQVYSADSGWSEVQTKKWIMPKK